MRAGFGESRMRLFFIGCVAKPGDSLSQCDLSCSFGSGAQSSESSWAKSVNYIYICLCVCACISEAALSGLGCFRNCVTAVLVRMDHMELTSWKENDIPESRFIPPTLRDFKLTCFTEDLDCLSIPLRKCISKA